MSLSSLSLEIGLTRDPLKFDYLQHRNRNLIRGPNTTAEGIRLPPDLLLLDKRSFEAFWFHSPCLTLPDFVDDFAKLLLSRLLAPQGPEKSWQLPHQCRVVHQVLRVHAAASRG